MWAWWCWVSSVGGSVWLVVWVDLGRGEEREGWIDLRRNRGG